MAEPSRAAVMRFTRAPGDSRFWASDGLKLGLLLPVVAAVAALFAVGAYMTEPWVPLVAFASLVTVGVVLWRPMLGLYMAVALVPLEVVSITLGDAGLTPAEVVFLTVGVTWAFRRLTQASLPFVPSPLGKPLLLLLLAIVPGIAVASDSFSVLKTLVTWTAFFLVYQMVVDMARPETVRRFLLVLAIAGGVVGLIAAIGSGGEQELIGAGDVAEGRAVGSFDHPNTLATFLALTLPGALALGLKGPTALRPIAVGAFALCTAGLALSLSRGGLLAAAGALAVMLVWRPARRLVLVAAVVVAGFAVTGASPFGDVSQVDTLERRVASVSYAAEGTDPRFTLWERLPEIVADHFVVGVGANGFSAVAPRYGLAGLNGTSSTYEHAHNIAFTFLAELGVFGLGALVWIVAVLVVRLPRACRGAAGLDRGLVCAIGAALFAVALQGMVDYTLRSNVIVALIFALAGCAVVLDRSARVRKPPGVARDARSRQPGRSALA